MYERVHLYYDFMFCLLNDRSFAQLKKRFMYLLIFLVGRIITALLQKLLLLSIIWM